MFETSDLLLANVLYLCSELRGQFELTVVAPHPPRAPGPEVASGIPFLRPTITQAGVLVGRDSTRGPSYLH